MTKETEPDNGDDPTLILPKPAKASAPVSRTIPTTDLQPSQLFADRYRIKRAIGRGGMGLVYLASDEKVQRLVAIKTVPSTANEVLIARFRREARLISELRHPNIVGVLDFGEAEDLLYLVMEYIDGEPLTAVLARDGALGPARTRHIAYQVADALALAHDLKVVHRDIKPDNIMVKRLPDGTDRVKVLDFGVAKIKREVGAPATIQTQVGAIIGSLRYISPEQVQGSEVTEQTDMYMFGCVLYEMLAGRPVFDKKSPADVAMAHVLEKPKPPAGVALPRALVDLAMRCLDKNPAARPANARAVLATLAPT